MKSKIGKLQIANFFLDLYKLQSGRPKTNDAEVRAVTSEKKEKDSIYELRVKSEDRWLKRRMSVGRLGESTGSKSLCYKVVYDELIVIKIPVKPITDFKDYLNHIQKESRIAARLGKDIECVSPGLSAIFKRIHRFQDEARLDSVELEKRYLMWLDDNYQHLKYLRIGDSFVFFMDLSKYMFLSSVISEMHQKDDFEGKVVEEIGHSSSLVTNASEIRAKSDDEEDLIYSRMKQLYGLYEAKVQFLIKHYQGLPPVSGYDIQNWFIAYITGTPLISKDQVLPESFVSELVETIRGVVSEHGRELKNYKQMIVETIIERTEIQNRPKMRGLVTNMLNVLALLMEKEVSIRDLKPDNIFVAGEAEKYPVFLTHPDEFSLGLIDFETAIRLDNGDGGQIGQPVIGGTPSYATPSHFFPNDILQNEYGSLKRIFFLQDWYAAIGIIYNIMKSRPLFVNTRKTLHKILTMRRAFVEKSIPLTEVFVYGGKLFWGVAYQEFKAALSRDEHLFKSVAVTLPDNVREMIHKTIVTERSQIQESIGMTVISQAFFDSYDKRKSLIQGSLKDIKGLRKRMEREKKSEKASIREKQRKAVVFLKKLEYLKTQAEHHDRMGKLLEKSSVQMTVFQILEIMFQIVVSSMYKPEWGKLDMANEGSGHAKSNDSGTPNGPGPDTKSAPDENVEKTRFDFANEPTVVCEIDQVPVNAQDKDMESQDIASDEDPTLVCDIDEE